MAERLLVPGRNCWRIERARRVAFLVDAAAYFAAARGAILRARKSIFILGWDFNSQTPLVETAGDGWPREIGPLLRAAARRNRKLHVHVLAWDFTMAFAGNREFRPLYKLGWKTHPAPRVAFHLDGRLPYTASHHQKVLVVDDAVAFVGGLDFTHGRWDTPEHPREHPMRRDVKGGPSRPNHDVQAIVDGEAARALGELCRDRWRRATDRVVEPPASVDGDPWPEGLEPEVADVDVAIARTDPGYAGGERAEEIRQLYIDILGAARRNLYLENQYFSSSVVGATLAARLEGESPPEVVVVSRLTEEGWLEESTMGLLRARLHQRLRAADRGDRYRLLYPFIPGLAAPDLLNVHSKVIVADDGEVASVGSANFNNRSMGFDTECNLVFEARGDERVRRALQGLRDRLLAEHLGTTPRAVADRIATEGSVVRAVDALANREGRALKPIDPVFDPELEALLPASAVVDPERPEPAERLAERFVPPDLRRPLAIRLGIYAAALLALGAAIITWRWWSPMGDAIHLRPYLEVARAHAGTMEAAGAIVAVYVVAGLLTTPVTFLVAATAVVFGPLLGGTYALAGSMVSAVITYALGRTMGRDAIRQVAGGRLNRITRALRGGGLAAVTIARLLPVASFPMVSAVAGASGVQPRNFLAGTALGIAPRIIFTVLFVDRVRAVIVDPGWASWSLALAAAAAIVAAAAFAKRIAGRAS